MATSAHEPLDPLFSLPTCLHDVHPPGPAHCNRTSRMLLKPPRDNFRTENCCRLLSGLPGGCGGALGWLSLCKAGAAQQGRGRSKITLSQKDAWATACKQHSPSSKPPQGFLGMEVPDGELKDAPGSCSSTGVSPQSTGMLKHCWVRCIRHRGLELVCLPIPLLSAT